MSNNNHDMQSRLIFPMPNVCMLQIIFVSQLLTGFIHCIQYVFDYKVGDVFGCMAALGWITGHSYVVYGPLCNGATTVLFEGTATHPGYGNINQVFVISVFP